MNTRKLLLLMLLFCSAGALYAQEFSNKGKEFWIAYPAHINGSINANSSVMGLYITSTVNTTGSIKLGGGNTINITVTANQVTKVFLGSIANMDASSNDVYLNMADGVKSNAAIKITTVDPVVVYSHIIQNRRSGAYQMVLRWRWRVPKGLR